MRSSATGCAAACAKFARGYDIVVVARTAAMQAPYRQLEGAYLRLAGKLGIYAQEAYEETKDT